jgi:hypothetical protein
MEPGIYFTTLVFAVGALHLLSKVVAYVTGYLAASGLRPDKSSRVPAHRDDWYMFFHRSDLTGEPEKKTKNKQENKKIGSSPGNYQRRDSRPALRRHLT